MRIGKKTVILLLLLQKTMWLFSFSLDNVPLCSIYTQNSILECKQKYRPLSIGRRKRWATCTGATWFGDNYLAALNLYGNKITTYKFYPNENRFEPLQEVDLIQDPTLIKPENLVTSPDGKLLAVCAGFPNAGIKIYEINIDTHLINPKPLFQLKSNYFVHNIRFSPDGKYLATATFDKNAAICIYKIIKNPNEIYLIPVYHQSHMTSHLDAKAINFTKDGRFAVVVYSPKNKKAKGPNQQGLILIQKFDTNNGQLEEIVSCIDDNRVAFCYEDAAFINNDKFIIFTDQNNDRIIIHEFNPITGQIDKNFFCIQGSEAQLSFPHGIGVKQDGKYFVVTNYGDDKFNLYQTGL